MQAATKQGLIFNLEEVAMNEVQNPFNEGTYHATRAEIARAFKDESPIVFYRLTWKDGITGQPCEIIGNGVFVTFPDGRVHIGCQSFDAENGKKLRAWALPEESNGTEIVGRS